MKLDKITLKQRQCLPDTVLVASEDCWFSEQNNRHKASMKPFCFFLSFSKFQVCYLVHIKMRTRFHDVNTSVSALKQSQCFIIHFKCIQWRILGDTLFRSTFTSLSLTKFLAVLLAYKWVTFYRLLSVGTYLSSLCIKKCLHLLKVSKGQVN